MKVKILTAAEMEANFTMQEAIAASQEAARLYSNGRANIPLRANLPVAEQHGQSLYMYGYVSGVQALGVKIVSVYPGNIKKGLNSVPATMVLLNAKTGEVVCLMDGTFLTRIRTGALVGAATDVLARKDSKSFALFGTGGQAKAQLEAILAVRYLSSVNVYDVDEARAKNFAVEAQDKWGKKYSAKIQAVATPLEAIQDADIITTVTTAKKAVFEGKDVKQGAHINGVGSYTPEMAEIDPYIVTCARVYVDTKEGALHESGDLLQPMQQGLFSAEQVVGELGEVLSGKVPGRVEEKDITFFETTGSAVFDLVTAQKIYEKALTANFGQMIEL